MAVPANTINEIRFTGNLKTKERILRQELTVRVGSKLDSQELEYSRQSIMDLGLFKSVTVEVLEKNVVLFTVKEKRYLLLLPRFSRDSDTDKITPGIKLTVDNIAGLNQRATLTLKQSDADDASSGDKDEVGLSYYYPKMFGTQYSLDVLLGFSREPLQFFSAGSPVADYKRQEIDLGFIVSRWLKKTGPSTGWVAGAGPRLHYNRYDYVSGMSGIYSDDHAISLLGQIFYTDIHDHLYSRTGLNYGYVLEQGLKGLGSDYDYNRHLFFYRQFYRLDRPHHNLNWQVRLGLSDDASSNLNEDVYSIGGYGDLRAYDSSTGGAAFVMLNVEYLRPMFDSNQVRGLLFADVGDAFVKNSDLDLSDLKWSVGTGLRWKIKSFVNLSLSLEYAYNVDTSENKVYFRTSGPF